MKATFLQQYHADFAFLTVNFAESSPWFRIADIYPYHWIFIVAAGYISLKLGERKEALRESLG